MELWYMLAFFAGLLVFFGTHFYSAFRSRDENSLAARIGPGDLVGAITGEAKLKGSEIGAISIHEMFSVVEVPSLKAHKIIKSLQHAKIRGRKVNVRFDRD